MSLRTDYTGALQTALINAKNAGKVLVSGGTQFEFLPSAVTPASDLFTVTDHGLVDDDQIELTTTGTLPAGLSTGTTYYVISATANTFQLSATQAGAAIDITDAGTGTHGLFRDAPNTTIQTELTNAANQGKKSFTINVAISYLPTSIQLNGPLWNAFRTGMKEALALEEIMDNEYTITLNTSITNQPSADIAFTF